MSLTRVFLGWDEPVLELAAARLLATARGVPPDLSDTLVVVPTRQAGRRLRERLAARAAGGLLSPRIVTPEFWFQPSGPVLSPAETLAIWTDLLRQADPAELSHVLPGAERRRDDFAWALSVAQQLQQVRRLLSEGGHTLASAAVVLAAGAEEERWQELAGIERLFLERAAQEGRRDALQAELETAAAPALPDGIRRVVVAGVPDPAPLAVRALEQVATRLPVEVWIHAPAEPGDAFDAWGRPAATWSQAQLPLDDAQIQLVSKPYDQAAAVMPLLPAGVDPVEELALGVLDPEVAPHLEQSLTRAGIPVFDPAEKPVSAHPLYRLTEALLTLAADDSYEAASALLRHPHFLAALEAAGGTRDLRPLLTALDALQNEHLPPTFAAVQAWTQPGAGTEDGLARACGFAAALVQRLRADDPLAALPAVLNELYGARRFARNDPAAARFEAAAGELMRAREQVDAPLVRAALPETATRVSLFLSLLAARALPAESDGPKLDLEGWLELHWNDGRHLVLTGCNEGKVPTSITGHPFLPDSARRTLGLACNDTRFARDVYLLAAMLACRRREGSVHIVLGKTSAQGDVLKPSRLLFRCEDVHLPERVRRLFSRVSEAERPAPAVDAFPLSPAYRPAPQRLHVTAFRDYLTCPFRFYLKHVLGMRELNDRKLELDALDFGGLCHEVLEAFARDDALRDTTDAAELETFLVGELERRFVTRYGRQLSAVLVMQLETLKQRLRHAARVQAQERRDGWCILPEFIEYKLCRERNGVTLVGKIDRIDRHADTGQYRLLDYKTSSGADTPISKHVVAPRPDSPDYARCTVARHPGDVPEPRCWADLQLPLYALLVRDTLGGVRPECGYFCLPTAVMETQVRLFEQLDDALLAQAEKCADDIITAVRDGRFWPPAARVDYDDFEALLGGGREAAVRLTGWPETEQT